VDAVESTIAGAGLCLAVGVVVAGVAGTQPSMSLGETGFA